MTTGDHPYRHQPARAFWSNTAGNRKPTEIGDWYTKKWDITEARIAAAGSCFAQHIGKRLRQSGFHFLDVEPAPRLLPAERAREWGFGLYSARYGNVYTTRQLLQLLQRATGEFVPTEGAWAQDGGFVDPFRPTLEPVPMASEEEVGLCASSHLESVLRLIEQTEVFVFTLGLTEGWVSQEDGSVFPVCPGTRGGSFDPTRHCFVNFGYPEVLSDLQAFIARARQIRNDMKFMLTVSPVPLMATATPHQVVVASTYSKAVLRAAAGHLADSCPYVDYFPSFEIVASHVMRGRFYEPDMRSVHEEGVEHVMHQFFLEHVPPQRAESAHEQPQSDEDVVCDEELLAAFGAPK